MSLWIFCNIAMKTKVNPPLDFENARTKAPEKTLPAALVVALPVSLLFRHVPSC